LILRRASGAGHGTVFPVIESEQSPNSATAPSYEYAAFISYKAARSLRCARQLQRGLYAVAKRHTQSNDFRIYLDRGRLGPGPLREEIYRKLEQSRCLIAVLDRQSVDSRWMRDEISHWLSTVGSPDRLYLVKSDPAIELKWDRASGDFAKAGDLPGPLRRLFPSEQSWIDFTNRRSGRREEELVRLCEKLTTPNAWNYLNEEVDFQRRRKRRLAGLTSVMAMLLVGAIVAAIAATYSRHQAVRNAQEAIAQADAAEALLLVPDAPVSGIARAVRASTKSESTTVRSAMLAVSQEARRLNKALIYPEWAAGHPVASVSFGMEGSQLLAWGLGPTPSTSFLQIWDLQSGAVVFSGAVPVEGLSNITSAGTTILAGCGAQGPVSIRLMNGAAIVSQLSVVSGAPMIGGCSTYGFSEGAIVMASVLSTGKESSGAYYLNHEGIATWVAGVDTVALHPSSKWAAMAGDTGVLVVGASGMQRLTSAPGAQVTSADGHGHFLARLNGSVWGFIEQQPAGSVLRSRTLPATVSDVAPLLNSGQMTGDLAWIENDGRLGWTRDDRSTILSNVEGTDSWKPYHPALESLQYEDFIAVYGGTAMVVRPPTGERVLVDAPHEDFPTGGLTEWNVKVIKSSLGSAPTANANPILGRCVDHDTVLTPGQFSQNGSMLLDGTGEPTRLDSRATFSLNCVALAAGRNLSVVPSHGHETLTVRENLVSDSVAISPTGTQVAVMKAGMPIEVLSTASLNELPRPWDASGGDHGVVAAMGEREVFAEPSELVFVDNASVIHRTKVPEFSKVRAVRPDGTEAILSSLHTPTAMLAKENSLSSADPACTGNVRYVPAPGFQHSIAAAEAQIPVSEAEGGALIDCRTGHQVPMTVDQQVLHYDIGANSGVIVVRVNGRFEITSWTRKGGSKITTIAGPSLSADGEGAQISVAPDMRTAVTYLPGSRQLNVYYRGPKGWQPTLQIGTGLQNLADAQLVGDGTLIASVSRERAFELYDSASGRLLSSDPNLGNRIGGAPTTGFSARRRGDDLFIDLRSADSLTGPGTIRIPISVSGIRRQLCSLYPAAGCP
jgi:hypothetical protein